MREAKKLFRWLIVSMAMIMAMAVPAFADEVNESVKDARNGVLQIRICYETKEGEEYYLGGGSAFLINDNTIVTCYHVTHQLDSYNDWATENIEGFDNNKITYKVVVRNDITLEAKIINKSEKSDFSILQLEQPIGNRKVLALDSRQSSPTQQIYALGFPDSVMDLQNDNTYTYEDVTIADGRVTKNVNISGVEFVQHSASLRQGYSGGPLVDIEGNVIGFNDAFYQENNYSVAISELTKALDDLGIEYTKAFGMSDEPEETSSVEEDTDIEEDTELEPDTTEAVKPTVAESEEDEKEEGILSSKMLIAIIAVVVVVIVVIIILILTLGGKKDNKQAMPTRQMPTQPVQPVSRTPQTPQYGAPAAPQPPQFSTSAGYGNEGAGETTVLNEGAGETTVLGVGAMAGGKTVVRIKNGDKLVINRPEFMIGKERRRVDYCVSDNNSVSRVHAKLVNRGGQLFLVDMNATNGTFVNGNKLNGGQEMLLNTGDKFKLADEEFQVQ